MKYDASMQKIRVKDKAGIESTMSPQRIFIVGVPRSGTTMVQSILNAHSQFFSFPESHFFSSIIFDLPGRKYGRMGMKRYFPWFGELNMLRKRGRTLRDKPNPRVRKRIDLFLSRAGLEQYKERFDRIPDSVKALTGEYIRILDEAAEGKGWIEKTPNHAFCVGLIERLVPDALFVHVVRNGKDALASIKDAADKYENWDQRYLKGADTVPRLVALWNRSVSSSLRHRHKKNHLIMRYEKAAENPEEAARRLARFLTIDFEPSMTVLNTENIIVKGEEAWKTDMSTRIRPAASKFDRAFTRDEQREIEKTLRRLPRFDVNSEQP